MDLFLCGTGNEPSEGDKNTNDCEQFDVGNGQPSITIKPGSGSISTLVNVTELNFNKDSPTNILYDGLIIVEDVFTDSNRRFSTTRYKLINYNLLTHSNDDGKLMSNLEVFLYHFFPATTCHTIVLYNIFHKTTCESFPNPLNIHELAEHLLSPFP